jgi:hypothetical protein
MQIISILSLNITRVHSMYAEKRVHIQDKSGLNV